MKRSLLLILAVIPIMALAACSPDMTGPKAPPKTVVSLNVEQSNLQLYTGSSSQIIIVTTIVGRDVASLADTALVKIDNPKIATIKRVAWSQSGWWDSGVQQPVIQVYETYLITGVASGQAVLTARASSDPKVAGQTLIGVIAPEKG